MALVQGLIDITRAQAGQEPPKSAPDAAEGPSGRGAVTALSGIPEEISATDYNEWEIHPGVPDVAMLESEIQVGSGWHIQRTIVPTKSGNRVARLKRDAKGNVVCERMHHPISERLLSTHVLVCGATGVRKTRTIIQILNQFYEEAKRSTKCYKSIDADFGGEKTEMYGQKDSVILNPFDSRFPGMEFMNEIRAVYDCDTYAWQLISHDPQMGGESQTWTGYAREATAESLRISKRRGGRDATMAVWAERMTQLTHGEMMDFFQGSPTRALLENEKTSQSVRGIISTYLRPWLFVKPGPFSLRDWVVSTTDRRRVFIPYFMSQIRTLNPLISALMSLAMTYNLSLPEYPPIQVLYVLDEFGQLKPMDAMAAAVTAGRKRGMTLLPGYQDDNQIIAGYGEKVAETLLGNLSTKILLRPGIEGTAERLSKELGSRIEWVGGVSDSVGVGRGASINDGTSLQTQERRVVLPSELMSLPEGCGYIRLAGSRNLGRIAIPYVPAVGGDGIPSYIEDPEAVKF